MFNNKYVQETISKYKYHYKSIEYPNKNHAMELEKHSYKSIDQEQDYAH